MRKRHSVWIHCHLPIEGGWDRRPGGSAGTTGLRPDRGGCPQLPNFARRKTTRPSSSNSTTSPTPNHLPIQLLLSSHQLHQLQRRPPTETRTRRAVPVGLAQGTAQRAEGHRVWLHALHTSSGNGALDPCRAGTLSDPPKSFMDVHG